MYFDYSASTPISEKALDAYLDATYLLSGNAQSLHYLGKRNKDQINRDKEDFKRLLNCPQHTVSFTQNASEANRKVIETIITTPQTMRVVVGPFEHSSIIKTLAKLQRQGLKVDVIEPCASGQINLDHLERLLRDQTDLTILSLVDSELGLIQEIPKIRKTKLLVDITQAIGKTPIGLAHVDFMTFSAHKFYGPKGLGGILHLDASFNFENGTLSEALIHSSCVALDETLKHDASQVVKLNQKLRQALKKMPHVSINNVNLSVPHVINISIKTQKKVDLVSHFSGHHMYVSKGSACQKTTLSRNVFKLTGSKEKATSSIRISLSHLTKVQEVEKLIEVIKGCAAL